MTVDTGSESKEAVIISKILNFINECQADVGKVSPNDWMAGYCRGTSFMARSIREIITGDRYDRR